jgi:CheY-like chemotaxis protein
LLDLNLPDMSGFEVLRSLRPESAALSPGRYRQLGCDPAAVVEEGKAAMRARFEAMRR